MSAAVPPIVDAHFHSHDPRAICSGVFERNDATFEALVCFSGAERTGLFGATASDWFRVPRTAAVQSEIPTTSQVLQ